MTYTDTVSLHVEAHAIVGILDFERTQPQPVVVDIDLTIDLETCAYTGDLRESVNYAKVDEIVRFFLLRGRFRLLESAAVAMCHSVMLAAANVTQVSIALSKPAILKDSTPQVTLLRNRAWCEERFGRSATQRMLTLPECTIELFNLAPGDTYSAEENEDLLVLRGVPAEPSAKSVCSEDGPFVWCRSNAI